MSLTQYFMQVSEANWGGGDEPSVSIPIYRFEQHSRLHGYMERLAYQKGLVDPFDRLELDYEVVQRLVQQTKLQTRPPQAVEYFGANQGRLYKTWLPLDREDLTELLSIVRGVREGTMELPICEGLFFGESSSLQWLETQVLIEDLLARFSWTDNTLAYLAEW